MVLGSAATVDRHSPGRTDRGVSQRMALPLPVIPPQQDAFHLAPHRIKRCTFRRLIQVEAGGERVYDVECLFPDRKVPIPLGDLDAATPICNACVAPHLPPRRDDRRRRPASASPRERTSSDRDAGSRRPYRPRLCRRSFVSEAVCKPSSVTRRTEVHRVDGHPSEAGGRPTAHAADPRAGQRASPPRRLPAARLRPPIWPCSGWSLPRFTPFADPKAGDRHRHCGTGPRLTADGRYPPPCAAELGLSSRHRRVTPARRATIRPPR